MKKLTLIASAVLCLSTLFAVHPVLPKPMKLP